jgi:protein involved in plasmid replication-relaxation
MTGNNRGLVLQPRDRRLLEELAIMRVVDREQAKIVAGFGSTTRVNARLLRLTEAALLKRFFVGTTAGGAKALYGLSLKGARAIGVPLRGPQRRQDEAIIADFFVEHQLAVNEVYCRLKFGISPAAISFRRWLAFSEPITQGLRLIPDGYVELTTPAGIVGAFLELDLGTESLTVWKEKVRQYLQLAVSGEFGRRFGEERFRVLVIAHSERRLHSIRQTVATITDKLFWFADQRTIQTKDFFGSVWFRPKGDSQETLIKELP